MSGWYKTGSSTSQARGASTWPKAKSFRTHPVTYHPFLKNPARWSDLVWIRASNPTIRCLTFVLSKSWVLSYLRQGTGYKLSVKKFLGFFGWTLASFLFSIQSTHKIFNHTNVTSVGIKRSKLRGWWGQVKNIMRVTNCNQEPITRSVQLP